MAEQVTYPHLSYPVLWAHVRGGALIFLLGLAIPFASQLYSKGADNPMLWESLGLAVLTTATATVGGAVWGVVVGFCMAIRVYLSGTVPLWLSFGFGLASSLALLAALHLRGSPMPATPVVSDCVTTGVWLALPIVATLWTRWRLRWSGTLRA